MAINAMDQLVEACNEADTWPLNLSRKQHINRVLKNHNEQLRLDEGRLFVTSAPSVEFWEAPVGQDMFSEIQKLRNLGEVVEHLGHHLRHRRKDPHSRHVFLSAAHSRASLRCTSEMFRYICSYQQVSPIVLGMLFSFGAQKSEKPLDFQFGSFAHDDLGRSAPGSIGETVPELGRSSWELRLCYKLFGMEKSDYDEKWTMRQTGVYHSFDMESPRTFWLSIKADGEIRNRVLDGSKSLDAMTAPKLGSLASAFISSLETHRLMLEWCTEGWTRQIGSFEDQVREVLVRVENMTIEAGPDEPDFAPQELLKSASMPPRAGTDMKLTSPSRQGTQHTQNRSIRTFSLHAESFVNRLLPGRRNATVVEAEKTPLGGKSEDHPKEAGEKQKTALRRLERLNAFKFAGLQKLNWLTTKLQGTRLAISLNLQALQDLSSYYQRRYGSLHFPKSIKDACEGSGHFQKFVDQVWTLEKHLQADLARVDTLMSMIEDGKRLYESILQSYNAEISKLFTLSGHGISQRMEASTNRMELVTDSMHKIAEQTARDSASMHVITFVTLVLLPGTFLGTFFSTPIIQGPDNGEGWSTNHGLLWLFVEICAPMMVVTLAVWYAYLRRLGSLKAALASTLNAENQC